MNKFIPEIVVMMENVRLRVNTFAIDGKSKLCRMKVLKNPYKFLSYL
jgi:hypothetical protein